MSSAPRKPQSWKKTEVQLVQEPPRHRWQSGSLSLERSLIHSLERSLYSRIFILMLAFVGLVGLLLFLLLWSPSKTPLITAAATDYAWPLPPNAWAYEDVQGFADLHRKSIEWQDSSDAWQADRSALVELRSQIVSATPLARRSGTMILYLSAHGAVNDNHQPCLIPAGSSPLASEQWIALHEIISLLPKSDAPFHTLLVLDCVDEQVNWNAGLVQSTFAERVQEWVRSQEFEHISVLLSAAPEQAALAGSELQASIFGREFRLGLCGAADRRSAAELNAQPIATTDTANPPAIAGGNGDGVVSLQELVTYLQREVAAWSQIYRGQLQTPLLIAKEDREIPLARALGRSEIRRLTTALTSKQLAAAEPSIDELASLWRMLDTLRQRECYRLEPRVWADLEHQLLGLEQRSQAGAAYTGKQSRALYTDLEKRLKEAVQRASSPVIANNLMARSRILNNVPAVRLDASHLPSLAWLDLLGEQGSLDTEAARIELISRMNSQLSTGALPFNVDEMLVSLGVIGDTQVPNELNFAALVQKYQCMQIWPDQSLVKETIELRDRCERLAVLGNVLGLRLRRETLHTMDETRRQVEDNLFVGPASGVTDIRQLLRSANEASDRVAAVEANIERALALHARTAAQIPYLAAWICSPKTDMNNLADWLAPNDQDTGSNAGNPAAVTEDGQVDTEFRERLAIQRLNRLISNLHELGLMLAQTRDSASATEDGTGLTRINQFADLVERDLQRIVQLVNDHQQRALARSDTDGANIAQIDGLLMLPILSASERVALHKKLDQHRLYDSPPITTQNSATIQEELLAVVKSEVDAESGTTTEDASHSSNYRSRMQRWPVHPISSILGIQESLFSLRVQRAASGQDIEQSSQESYRIDELNETIRDCYVAFTSFSSEQLSSWMTDVGMDVPDEFQSMGTWERTAQASNIERSLLPMCGVRPESDATTLLIRLAVRELTDWYVDRTLRDFYADGRALTHSETSPDYFEDAVLSLLQLSANLPRLDESDAAAELVQKRLDVLRAYARNGLRPTVSAGIPDPLTNLIQYEVEVQSILATIDSSALSTFWPSGTAAAMLESDNGALSSQRKPIGIPIADSGLAVTLSSDESQVSQGGLISFRGHEFRVPLLVGQGTLVDYYPFDSDRSQVVLFGDRVQQPSIVFVLDCSWSMGEAMPIEAQSVATQLRLDLAKSHTLRLIEKLAMRGDARLGLRLFGHRLGWTRPVDPATGVATGKTEVVPQPNYPWPIPDDITPSRDVEAIVPLGRFTPEMIGALTNKISPIVPWGQSPLYLSLVEALQDFSADSPSTTKSIVVITDGDNFQFNASRRPGGNDGIQTSVQDVLAAWQSHKVPIYILGVAFEDDAGTGESSTGRTALKELAEKSGGKFYDINHGGDLLQALAEQATTATYAVRPVGPQRQQTNEESDGVRLNEPIDIQLSRSGVEEKFRVDYQTISKDISLRGGEALEMYVTEDGQDIRSQPYDIQLPRSAMLTRDNDERLTARVHRPIHQDSGVMFPVSFQDSSQPFTPRPLETWIEVSPVAASGKPLQQTYIFYDTNYDPKTPVPRESWLATDWPNAVQSADVQIWARYDRSPVNATVSMRELRERPTVWSAGAVFPGLQQVTWKIVVQETSSAWRLHVTEIHDSQSRGVGSMRLALESASMPRPRRVTHRFDRQSGIAVHTFEYDPQVGKELLSTDTVQLTVATREYALNGAYRLQEPIRVEIATGTDLLPIATSNDGVNTTR